MNRLITALLLCIALTGCAQITPYRTRNSIDAPCIAQNTPAECPDDALYLAHSSWSESDGGIPIGIIEFDDKGALQSRSFKNEIISKVEALTQEHSTLTVVYAHGWLNNAAPDNANLAQFQNLLKGIEDSDRDICRNRSCAGRKVVGIYLAWRGVSATVQPFKALSFWNRKKGAHRVGQDGATEVLTELGKIKAGNRKNRLILIGHSFGGALLYSATQSLLMKDTAYAPRPGTSVPRSTADLVVLVNPAFEAARLTSLYEKAATMKFPTTQSPILAIFTSKTDNATKLAFPLGRRLSSLFTKYNPTRPDQAKLDRTAIGHYPGYQTHELTLKDKGACIASRIESVCKWEDFRKGETHTWDLNRITLKRKDRVKEKSQQMNPYYNVVVDDAIISGHGGIWEPEYFMEFIARFVTVQNAKTCAQYRAADGVEISSAHDRCQSD